MEMSCCGQVRQHVKHVLFGGTIRSKLAPRQSRNICGRTGETYSMKQARFERSEDSTVVLGWMALGAAGGGRLGTVGRLENERWRSPLDLEGPSSTSSTTYYGSKDPCT